MYMYMHVSMHLGALAKSSIVNVVCMRFHMEGFHVISHGCHFGVQHRIFSEVSAFASIRSQEAIYTCIGR